MREFLKERGSIFWAAKESKFIWFGAGFIGLPTVAAIWEWATGGLAMIFNVPLWAWGVMLAGYCFFFGMLEYAVSLSRKLAPRITLDFRPKEGGLVFTREETTVLVKNPDGTLEPAKMSHPSIYVRVKVDSIGGIAANNCAAFLKKITKRPKGGALTVGNLHDGLQLPWSLHPVGIGEISLPPNIPRHFDVCKTSEDGNKLQLLGGVPFSLDGFFDDIGEYEFLVAVTANGKTSELTFTIEWDGHWNTIKAQKA